MVGEIEYFRMKKTLETLHDRAPKKQTENYIKLSQKLTGKRKVFGRYFGEIT